MDLNSCGKIPDQGSSLATKILLIMKLSVALCLITCVQIYAKGYAQLVTLSEKEVPVTQVFEQIRKQTGYSFFYKENLVKDLKVSVAITDADITDALKIIFENQPISYTVVGKTIVLKRQSVKKAGASVPITIKGRVLDENGEPMIGVSIKIKGLSIGTTTDVNGYFSLTAEENAVLLVAFIGYTTQEIPVDKRSEINITLQPAASSLDEVVVVGYGTQSKRNISTAVSNLNAEDLIRSSSTTTAGALTGKMPGVSTRARDSRPGRGINLEIRNMGRPLYVIDGIPYGGNASRNWLGTSTVSGEDAFNALSLEDIESISILKDAAAAVYGLRAANGVVLVTTKKGSKDNAKIRINSYYGIQNLTRFPELATAGQYVRGLVEAAQNQGGNPAALYSKEELAKWESGTEPGYKSYDYYDIIMRKNVPQYNLNANVSGGTEQSTYYLSLGRTTQEATMKDFDYTRDNFQANLESKISKRLTVGTQASGRLERTRDVGLPGGDGYFASILSLFSSIPTYGPYANDNPEYMNSLPNRPDLNPALFERDIAGFKDNFTKNMNINLFTEYKFDFGLSAKATYSYNYTHLDFNGFQYSYDFYTYNRNNDTYNLGGGQSARWRFESQTESASRYGQFMLNYTKKFGSHNLSSVLAYERSDYDWSEKWSNTAPTNNYIPFKTLSELTGYGEGWNYQARSGYIGRIDYSFRDKYMLGLFGRYDASYLYAQGKRWGFFPGASLAWRVTDEPFFGKLKNIVNDLKLRVSAGQTGSEAGVAMFGYLPGYNYNQGIAVLDGKNVIGARPRGLPITNLSWEKNTTYNAGIDATFLQNKFSLTADVFRKIISGRPAGRYDVLLPSEAGYTLPNENLNKDEYRGVEGMLTYTSKIGTLNYNIGVNATYSRFRNMETYKPRFGNSWNQYRNSIEDRWGGIWWGYQAVGRFQSEEEIRNHPIDNDGQNNRNQLPGDIIYKDVNGDGVINGMDERPIGFPTGWAPMLSFGSNIGLQWKGFNLNMDFAGATMQSWFQDFELRNAFHAGGTSPAYLLTDRWHRADPYDPNSEWISGKYPAIRKGTSANNGRNSDFWLHDVRFIRLKNLELGYTLPKNLTNRLRTDRIRFYLSSSNLFSIDNLRELGVDPEIEARAAVVYPQQRTFLAGFNLTF